jgi:hypothetical protein
MFAGPLGAPIGMCEGCGCPPRPGLLKRPLGPWKVWRWTWLRLVLRRLIHALTMSAILLLLNVDVVGLACAFAVTVRLAGSLGEAGQGESLCGRWALTLALYLTVWTVGGWNRLSRRGLADARQTGQTVRRLVKQREGSAWRRQIVGSGRRRLVRLVLLRSAGAVREMEWLAVFCM